MEPFKFLSATQFRELSPEAKNDYLRLVFDNLWKLRTPPDPMRTDTKMRAFDPVAFELLSHEEKLTVLTDFIENLDRSLTTDMRPPLMARGWPRKKDPPAE